jgi:hypothetical protein
VLAAAALGAGCSDGDAPAPTGPPAGYVRFETPPITLQPGENRMWMQWVALPADEDRNIADLIGFQGPGGHHAVLYHTTEVQPVGTTRDFLNEDQSEIHLIGGIGGEGGEAVKLPPGVVFRVPAGRALLVQTHYLNTTDAPIEGHSIIDVKFSAPAPDDKLASFFVSSAKAINVPANSRAERDVTCVLERDLPMLMFANHMHEWGMTITTTITPPGATSARVLKDDPVWDLEWTYNPEYEVATVEQPIVLSAGSTITTHCEWNNTTAKVLNQPDEMCLFLGFFIGDKDATCLEGTWYE